MTPLEIVKAATEAINAGEIEKALGVYADSVVQRSPHPDQPVFRERTGKDALRKVLNADIHGPSNVQFHHNRYVCEGTTVAVEGTNVGRINGREVRQPVALFYVIQDDRIASVTIYYDRLGLRKVLGQQE